MIVHLVLGLVQILLSVGLPLLTKATPGPEHAALLTAGLAQLTAGGHAHRKGRKAAKAAQDGGAK